MFSELDNGIANLKAAREKLKIYRQAVLKKAFEGELTREWRAQQKDLPTADELLEQIKAERKVYYQKQLKEWQQTVIAWDAQGRKGKKPGKPKKTKELPPLTEAELADLPKLPEDMKWVKIGHISEVTGGVTKNSKRHLLKLKIPYLRVANVYANKLNLEEVLEIGINEEELERVLSKKGDLLIVEGNGSPDQIGRVAVWNGKIPNCVHQNHLIKARCFERVIPQYILYFLLSKEGRNAIKKVASSTSGLYTLSLSKIESLAVPVFSEEEQHQIVQEIETRLSVCDKLAASIDESLEKAEALRQSILKKAFEGKLLSEAELEACRQAPDWEPAWQLLERIKGKKVPVQGNLFEV